MRTLFLVFLALHGLIHLLGFAKAFDLAKVRGLLAPISRTAGALWLAAALLFLAASGLLALGSGAWWMVAVPAVVVSQALIARSWADAKFGSIANVVVALPVVIALLGALPTSYASRYAAEVGRRLKPDLHPPVVTEEDLRPLPSAVQRYLRYAGAVGRPRVVNVRAVFHGAMKRKKAGGWMPIAAQQVDFFDDPARLFYIRSSLFGIPFDGLHRYVGRNATMQIRVANLVRVADARGDTMTRSETVTLFNDMCVLAPATLIAPSIQWRAIDSLSVAATFTNQGYTVAALLSFDSDGRLTSFVSDDRYLSASGASYQRYPWSTPLRDYRDFGGRRVAALDEAVWRMPDGDYPYARFVLDSIEYNLTR